MVILSLYRKEAPAISKKTRDHLIAYSFIAPNFIGFAVFTLAPLCFALALSLMKWDSANPIEFVGFDNYIRLTSDKQFLRALSNTAVYTVGVVPVTLICSLGLAILLNKPTKGRGFFRTVTFFPYVASLVSLAAVWNFVFNPSRGPVNALLNFVTGIPFEQLPRWGASRDWAMFTVILFSVWKNMGYYMVIYLAGLQGINPELYEAASLDGANARQKFRHVTLPQLAPTTFFVMIMLVISSFKVYDIFLNLFGGNENQLNDFTRVIVYQIYNTAFRIWDFGYASSMAIVLFIIVLTVTLVQFRGQRKFDA
ncbi:MAG: sugar ABC transporter permease [Clostridiales bacterium]|jgi:multiple sugar transport system permease protein|nr:sugar ABC transporter permease [Clostridiales bacterium]